MVIVEDDDAIARPLVEILGQQLGKWAGQAIGGIADPQALANSITRARDNSRYRIAETGRECPDVGRRRSGPVPNGIPTAM